MSPFDNQLMLRLVAEDVVVHQLEVAEAYRVVEVREVPLDADHRLGRRRHVHEAVICTAPWTAGHSFPQRFSHAKFLLQKIHACLNTSMRNELHVVVFYLP